MKVRDRLRHGHDRYHPILLHLPLSCLRFTQDVPADEIRSNKSFLWAFSVINQISKCRGIEEVCEALGRIPDNIRSMYQSALEKVVHEDVKHMKRILRWMLRKERPLLPAKLATAAGLNSPSAVREICSRVLLETRKDEIHVAGEDRKLDLFSFTHSSVEKYLEAVVSGLSVKLGTRSEKITRFVFSTPKDTHWLITKRCLEILAIYSSGQKNIAPIRAGGSDSDPGDTASESDTRDGGLATWDSDLEDAGFDLGSEMDDSASRSTADGECYGRRARRYAAEFWFCHHKKIDRERLKNSQMRNLDNEISQFLLDPKKLRFWLEIYDPDAGPAEKDDGDNEHVSLPEYYAVEPSPVYYAVDLELELATISVQLVDSLARAHTDPAELATKLDMRGRKGTAFQMTAHRGNLDTLDALIMRKADVNAEKGVHGTALYAAAATGNAVIVEMLLKADAKPDGTDDGNLSSPLQVAAFKGYDKVVYLTLERGGVTADHRAGPFGTALQAASASGRHIIV